jgi:hypothetical protein
MDPYIEHPAHWPDVHHRLITNISNQLNACLPQGFVARIEERVYVLESDRGLIPDIAVVQQRAQKAEGAASNSPDAPLVVTLDPLEVTEPYIEIVPARGDGRVITAIEVLSISNKIAGSEGQKLYLQKQKEVLASRTHLVELDFLRDGAHTVAVPPASLHFKQASWHYVFCVHRSDKASQFEVWPRTVRQRLPRISIPLQDRTADVSVDLQAAFDRAYDDGVFSRRLDYTMNPEPPLRPADGEWLDALLREKKYRS